MIRFKKKLLFRTGYHLLFWLAIYGLFVFSAYLQNHDLKGVIFFNLVMLPVDMIGVYLTIYLLIPRLLFAKRYVLFGTVFLFFSAGYILLIVTPYSYVLLHWFAETERWPTLGDFIGYSFLYTTIIFLMITGLAAAIKIMKRWILLQKQKQKLEKEQLTMQVRLQEAELASLKLQLHPHFLFNTLNNLYGLILKGSKKAPDTVLKLSEMLQYMLYDCSGPRVLLVREIQFIRNYLELERLRHDSSVRMDLRIQGDPANLEIAPMILLPLVENAVKHGLANSIRNPWLQGSLDIKDGRLIFTIENARSSGLPEPPGTLEIPRGIGLANVEKRLDMLYPGHYKLELSPEGEKFSAVLCLDLTDHS